jgi:hypothetical protein
MGLAMRKFTQTAAFAVGFAAASAVATLAHADIAPSLQSFGASQALSAYELSATGVAGAQFQPQIAQALNQSGARLANIAYGTPVTLSRFASSTVLTPNLALDSGYGLDIAARFSDYDNGVSPFLTPVSAPFLGLANGGRYAGVTFVPAQNLRVRLGSSVNSERLDSFHFDPAAPAGNLGLTYDASQTKSLLAGVSWDVTAALGLSVSGISAERSGVPLGLDSSIAPRASTNAISVAAHLKVGAGWVTTASFSEGLSQLDQKGSVGPAALHEQSFSIAVTKNGLFGNDALGLSFSRPAPSMAGSFNSLIGDGAGELPPLVVANAPQLGTPHAQENDVQLGYVTNFLNGAVSLQTNAAYKSNYQGQPGATSVSLLSRAKIKF